MRAIRLPQVGEPCYVIAEAGVNHNGDVDTAKRLVEVAANSGADAVKFQTFKTERLVLQHAPKAEYQKRTTGSQESQFQMLKRLELSHADHIELFRYCASRQITFLSTPFDEESADFLDELGVEAFKISSGDLTNLPFLEHVAEKGKLMIVSTGMATLSEVRTAVDLVTTAGNRNLILLHCVSDYPAQPSTINLKAMQTLADAFGFPVGYSDHTRGIDVALAAVARGAVVLEKHFTLSRTLQGPDHLASLEPEELAALVQGVRNVEAALGSGAKEPTRSEMDTAHAARRSLVAARAIAAGSVITPDMILRLRPGTGLPPSMLPNIVGRYAVKDIPSGTLLTLEMVS
jgi:N-acetylneuraminate synthase